MISLPSSCYRYLALATTNTHYTEKSHIKIRQLNCNYNIKQLHFFFFSYFNIIFVF